MCLIVCLFIYFYMFLIPHVGNVQNIHRNGTERLFMLLFYVKLPVTRILFRQIRFSKTCFSKSVHFENRAIFMIFIYFVEYTILMKADPGFLSGAGGTKQMMKYNAPIFHFLLF